MRDRDVLNCIPFFFSGKALRWFEVERALLYDVGAFRNRFAVDFGAREAQMIIRENIERHARRGGIRLDFESARLTASPRKTDAVERSGVLRISEFVTGGTIGQSGARV